MRTVPSDHESISASGTRFHVRYQMEALLQQRLKARLQLLARHRHSLLRFGVHVVEVGVHPARLVGDLAIIDSVRQLDKPRERDMACKKSANSGAAPKASPWVGICWRGPYAGDLKCGLRLLCRG